MVIIIVIDPLFQDDGNLLYQQVGKRVDFLSETVELLLRVHHQTLSVNIQEHGTDKGQKA